MNYWVKRNTDRLKRQAMFFLTVAPHLHSCPVDLLPSLLMGGGLTIATDDSTFKTFFSNVLLGKLKVDGCLQVRDVRSLMLVEEWLLPDLELLARQWHNSGDLKSVHVTCAYTSTIKSRYFSI